MGKKTIVIETNIIPESCQVKNTVYFYFDVDK